MRNPVDEMTRRWLDEAGVGAGMRVIDMGCGPGVVTVELAQRVGPNGRVFAVDRSPPMLAMARERCRSLGLTNVELVEGTFELPELPGGPVDAAVGRRVLMYQPNPVECVQSLARVVRPGGLVWFHEHDGSPVGDPEASVPLHDRVRGWLHAMLLHEGASVRMGYELFGVLRAAGLVVEEVRAEANLVTPESEHPIAPMIRQIQQRIIEPGIATAEEIDVDTLDARLARERRETGATIVWDLVFCAWARTRTDA